MCFNLTSIHTLIYSTVRTKSMPLCCAIMFVLNVLLGVSFNNSAKQIKLLKLMSVTDNYIRLADY